MGKYIIVSNHNHEILRNCCSLRRRGGLRWHPTSRRSRPRLYPSHQRGLRQRQGALGSRLGQIELLTLTTKTAVSLSPTTGRVPSSALNPGSAEVPDFAREVDGALDTTDVREPHSQTRPQDSPQ